MARSLLLSALPVLTLLADSVPAGAEEISADASRIQTLEREVDELKILVRDLAAERDAARAAPVDPLAYAPDRAAGSSMLPRVSLRGFGDVRYDIVVDNFKSEDEQKLNYFALGDLDLLLTSELGSNLDVLVEPVLQFQEDGGADVDIDRMLLHYQPRSWLGGAAGRGHTPLGWWNQHYQHGGWTQTTVERPLIYRFEGEGGILPMHYVGLEFSGQAETSPGTWSYAFNLANGRDSFSDSVQSTIDENDSKMVGGMIRFQPSALPGFAIGINAFHDSIPPESEVPSRTSEISELIAGFHAIYLEDPFEVLLENQFLHHRDGETHVSYGGFLQLGYRMKAWKPYFRFDWIRLARGDAFFDDLGVEDTNQGTFGVRWDWATWAALKIEYRRALADEVHANETGAQLSFAF
jgi:hypothetical protein